MADKTVVVRLVARVGQLTSGMAQAAGSVQTFGNAVAASSAKASASAKKLAGVSALAGQAVLVGIGAAMAVGAKAAIDFESSMAGVAKTVDASQPEIDALGETLREMSLRTPISVNDLAQIAEIGGQLGVPLSDMEDFTEVVAALGVTTNLSVSEAATGLARFANVMGTSFDDFNRLGSVLVELGNNFAANEAEILRFATRLAPIGSIVGATEEEVLGLAAGFAQLGVPAERGATAIQRLFIEIESAVEAGGEALEGFAGVAGQTIDEFASQSAVDRFLSFVNGLGQIEDAGGSAIGTLLELGITEQRTISVLLSAASAGDQFFSAIRAANEEGDRSTALFEEAAKRYGTTASQMQLLANAFTDFRIEIGREVIPLIRSAINWLRDLFAGLKDNYPTIRTFAQILAVIGGMNFVAGTIASIALQFKAAHTAAKTASLGIGILKGGLALLNVAAAGTLAVFGMLAIQWANDARRARELKQAAEGLVEALESDDPTKNIITTITEFAKTQGRDIADIKLGFAELGMTMEDFAEQVAGDPEAFMDYATALQDDIGGAILDVQGRFDTFVGIIAGKEGDVVKNFYRDLVRGGAPNPEDLGRWEQFADSIYRMAQQEKALKQLQGFFSDMFMFDEMGGSIWFGKELPPTLFDEFFKAYDAQKAEDAIKFMREYEDFEIRRATNALAAWRATEQANAGITRSNRDMFMAQLYEIEDAEDRWDAFNDAMDNSWDELVSGLEDAKADIRSTLVGGINPWEEYKTETIDNVNEIIDSLDAQVADYERWANTIASLGGEVSEPTKAWLRELPFEQQAALGKLAEDAPAEFDRLIAEFERVYGEDGELEGITQTLFGERLDGLLEDGVTTMLEDAHAAAEELVADTSLNPADAIAIGIVDRINDLPEDIKGPAQMAIAAGMGDEGVKTAAGMAGENIVRAFADYISQNAWRARVAAREAAKAAEEGFDSVWWFGSPSRYAQQLGQQVMQGFSMGLKRGVQMFDIPDQLMAVQPRTDHAIQSDRVIDRSRRFEVNINNPTTNDLRRDTQTALILSSLAAEV